VTALVVAHAIASAWHGQAHDALAVALTPAQTAFVYVIILAAPLVGAALMWTRFTRAGLWTVFVSMLGALLFGVYYHYIAVSPDHIAHLPPGPEGAYAAFVRSAATIAGLECAGTLLAAFRLFARPRAVPARS
jgi:hypothetical protein